MRNFRLLMRLSYVYMEMQCKTIQPLLKTVSYFRFDFFSFTSSHSPPWMRKLHMAKAVGYAPAKLSTKISHTTTIIWKTKTVTVHIHQWLNNNAKQTIQKFIMENPKRDRKLRIWHSSQPSILITKIWIWRYFQAVI